MTHTLTCYAAKDGRAKFAVAKPKTDADRVTALRVHGDFEVGDVVEVTVKKGKKPPKDEAKPDGAEPGSSPK